MLSVNVLIGNNTKKLVLQHNIQGIQKRKVLRVVVTILIGHEGFFHQRRSLHGVHVFGIRRTGAVHKRIKVIGSEIVKHRSHNRTRHRRLRHNFTETSF